MDIAEYRAPEETAQGIEQTSQAHHLNHCSVNEIGPWDGSLAAVEQRVLCRPVHHSHA